MNNALKNQQNNSEDKRIEQSRGDEFDFPFHVSPASFVCLASLPMVIGAYIGYKVELRRAATTGTESYTPGSVYMGNNLLSRMTANHQDFIETKSSTAGIINGDNATRHVTKSMARTTATSGHIRVDPGRIAIKALGIGTLLSIGGVGLLTAGKTSLCSDHYWLL